MKKADKHNDPKKGRAARRFVFAFCLFLVCAILLGSAAVFRFDRWRELDPSLLTPSGSCLRICSSDGGELYYAGSEKRIPVKIETLDKLTVEAFVSAEDARFYTHKGVDIYRIFGAAWADIKAGGYVQGASTISQQLIKLSHLSSEKTLDRKLEEAVLAASLEQRYTKDEIMEMYLNYIYFGGGYYGIEAASLGYFGVHASELTAAQAAQLAGILKSPSSYAPHIDPEASISRRNTVLRLMHEYGYIDDDSYSEALSEECVLKSAFPNRRSCLTDRAVDEALELTGLSRDELFLSGYTVYCTMDVRSQSICEELMSDDSLFPCDNAQVGLVLLDSTGGVAAMVSGRGEYDPSAPDRAAGSERQPGSLIKPIIVYAPALEMGVCSPSAVLIDEPETFGDYSPRNSDDKYYGSVTLRTAVLRSLNVPAVSLLEKTGVETAVDFARSFGVDFEGESLGLSLALGGFTHGVSPLEMAGAYSVFANGGVYIKPSFVDRIEDSSGRIVYQRHVSGRRIMSAGNAFILTSMLKSVAEEGTGRRLSETGLPLAAKTGTAVDDSGVRDAWCAAYTRDYTAVIHMGTDSAELGSLLADSVGGNHTAVILGRLFSRLYEGGNCPDFEKPDEVEEVVLDVSEIENGCVYLADGNTPEDCAVKEYFIRGTAPSSTDPKRRPPCAPEQLGWCIDEHGDPVISFAADPMMEYKILRSEANGEEIELFRSEAGKDYVSFTDRDALPGGVYIYRVEAANPNLCGEDGSPVYGASSRKMRVVAPYL